MTSAIAGSVLSARDLPSEGTTVAEKEKLSLQITTANFRNFVAKRCTPLPDEEKPSLMTCLQWTHLLVPSKLQDYFHASANLCERAQDRVEAVMSWEDPSKTLFWIAAWATMCTCRSLPEP